MDTILIVTSRVVFARWRGLGIFSLAPVDRPTGAQLTSQQTALKDSENL